MTSMPEQPNSNDVWFLNKKDVPADYKTVGITVEKTTSPSLPVKWCADGSTRPLPAYKVTLTRGEVAVESADLWPHKPPLDVVVHHLSDEEFMRLLCRKRGPDDSRMASPGWPDGETLGFGAIQ